MVAAVSLLVVSHVLGHQEPPGGRAGDKYDPQMVAPWSVLGKNLSYNMYILQLLYEKYTYWQCTGMIQILIVVKQLTQ